MVIRTCFCCIKCVEIPLEVNIFIVKHPVYAYKNKNGYQKSSRTFARVRLSADGRFPREIVEKVLAGFAVQTFGVVCALALTVDHVRFADGAVLWQATRRVSITRTRPSDDHFGYGVIIFFLWSV